MFSLVPETRIARARLIAHRGTSLMVMPHAYVQYVPREGKNFKSSPSTLKARAQSSDYNQAPTWYYPRVATILSTATVHEATEHCRYCTVSHILSRHLR